MNKYECKTRSDFIILVNNLENQIKDLSTKVKESKKILILEDDFYSLQSDFYKVNNQNKQLQHEILELKQYIYELKKEMLKGINKNE